MEFESISPDGLHIAGDFQGWIPEATEMEFVDENIYAYTTILSSGTYQEYKFINGNSWENAEVIPFECAANGNRYFTVPDIDDTLTAFCYSYCIL